MFQYVEYRYERPVISVSQPHFSSNTLKNESYNIIIRFFDFSQKKKEIV